MSAFESNVIQISDWDDFFRYNPASRHRRRIIHGLIAKHRLSFESILDVGCGDGRLLEEMYQRYKKNIHGVELGPSTAPIRLRSNLKGFYSLDIQTESVQQTFDLLLCTEVLEHLRDPEAAVRHLRKMCKKFIIITVPGGKMVNTDRLIGHLRHYTLTSLVDLMGNGGFEAIACFKWGFPFHTGYKHLLNFNSSHLIDSFGKGAYGKIQKTVSQLINAAFYLNSWRFGSQIFYLGKIKP
jgi:SAM-dependent methyltransferase